MTKYIVTLTATHTSYAEVEIEAETAEEAEDLVWSQYVEGTITLHESPGDIEIESWKEDLF